MKGQMISRFRLGDFVRYSNGRLQAEGFGHISKLHKSTVTGTAEIKPVDGTHKISRRLFLISKA